MEEKSSRDFKTEMLLAKFSGNIMFGKKFWLSLAPLN